jgi:hypothetical protein
MGGLGDFPPIDRVTEDGARGGFANDRLAAVRGEAAHEATDRA